MRKIEFRIWADNRFYYKCLVGNTNNVEDSKWTCSLVWLEDKKQWVHCDNGIICQYTGLKDKNKKRIYEGDILRVEKIDLAQIIYDEDRMAWGIKPINDFYFDSPLLADNTSLELEVIGNIYENADLLEAK